MSLQVSNSILLCSIDISMDILYDRCLAMAQPTNMFERNSCPQETQITVWKQETKIAFYCNPVNVVVVRES